MADAPGHLQIPKPQVVRRAVPAAAPSALVVGAVDDPAEHEADRMADAVLGSLRRSPIATSAGPTSTRIARAPAATLDEDIDPDDLDPENGTAEFAGPDTNDAPQPDPQSPGTVNRSPAASAAIVGAAGGEVDADTSARIRRSSGRPLDPTVRGEMESGFGTDFGAVRVHTGGEAEQLNRSLSAQAFTTGSDIFLGAGTPSSSTDAGRHLLAHELAHVVQQTAPSTVARRSSIVRRKFDPAPVTSNAHLRDDGQWGTTKGPKIKKGATVLVNTAAPKTQQKRGSTTTWYPAVNAGPDDWGTGLGDERRGYIRSSRVGPATSDLNVHLGTLVRDILQDAEAWQANARHRAVHGRERRRPLDQGAAPPRVERRRRRPPTGSPRPSARCSTRSAGSARARSTPPRWSSTGASGCTPTTRRSCGA